MPLAVTPGITDVYLKAITGANEIAVEDASSRSALLLLDGLLCESSNQPLDGDTVARIVTADRDRLLAHLYLSIYGNKVNGTVTCTHCKEPFDIDFSLLKLLQHYTIRAPLPSPDGTYHLEPSVHFRLPTGEDEILIAALPAQHAEKMLIENCIVSDTPEAFAETVQRRMIELAPLLNVEMESVCPECGHSEPILFDMQSFLLQKLLQERPRLLREIHLIASQYHWPQQEILHLPRKMRKQYAAMIDAETESW